MELSLLMRVRIALVAAIGIAAIGIFGWPLVKPADPLGAVVLSGITVNKAIILAGLAFLTGLTAYFISWPFGCEIGVLAVPFGLTVWAMRTGDMSRLLLNPAPSQRETVYSALRWEPFFWIAIIVIGFAGVFAAHRITGSKNGFFHEAHKDKSISAKYLNAAIALVVSVLAVQFLLALFAQDVRISDSKLGSVIGQPQTGQIIFAVFAAFVIVSFAAKMVLDSSYIWPTVATGFVTAFAVHSYLRQDVLAYLTSNQPLYFFSNSVLSILPLQIAALGSLGAITGYWMAVRYQFWRKHEN